MNILFIICLIIAQVKGFGTCPDAVPMENFNFNHYANGRWFEIARYEYPLEKGADCVFFDYVLKGKEVHCMLREIVGNKEKIFDFTVTLSPNAGTAAKLSYTALQQSQNITVNLFLLNTDYRNYSILYHCSVDDATQNTIELAWIKSRTPRLNSEVKAVVAKFLESHPFLDRKKFHWDHFTYEDCLINV